MSHALPPLSLSTEKLKIASQVTEHLSNSRIFLTEKDSGWILETGGGELFAARFHEGTPVSHLFYIATLIAGEMFFSFPEGELQLVLITTSITKLRHFELSSLKALSDDSEGRKELSGLLTEWLNHFSSLCEPYVEGDKPPIPITQERLSLKPGETLFPSWTTDPSQKRLLTWIEVDSGELHFFGSSLYPLVTDGSLYPFIVTAWARSEREASFTAFKTEEILLEERTWSSLFAFHARLLVWLERRQEKLRIQEENRLIQKQNLESKLLDQSFHDMAHILQGTSTHSFIPDSNLLYCACQCIGSLNYIQFIKPTQSLSGLNVQNQLNKICYLSQVRYRSVYLEREWWKSDCGTLLGFYGAEKKPIVLQLRGRRYYMIDPSDDTSIPLDNKIAAELSSQAYTFYTPFPEKALSGFHVVKFCLAGKSKEIGTVLFIGVLGALFSLFPPFANEVIFNQIIKSRETVLLPQILMGLVVVAISTSIFLVTRSYTVLRVSQLVDARLEAALWDRILNLPVRFFRRFTAGNLIQRVYAVSQMHQLVSGSAVRAILSAAFSFFYFISMFIYSAPLAWIALIIVGAGLVTSSICMILKVRIQRKLLSLTGQLNGMLVQFISGISKLRINGAENRAFVYWSHPFTESKLFQYKAQSIQNIVSATTAMLPVASSAILFTFVIGMLKENDHSLSVGALIAFLAAYVPFSSAIFDALNTLINMSQVFPLWERAKVIFDEKPEQTISQAKTEKLLGKISCEHLVFRYSEGETPMLNDLSLFANPEEFVGIVGASGCGKSTLVRLLIGFETPEKGSIYFDDKDLADLNIKDVRKQIGTVLQNGTLFAGSLYENIVCGSTYPESELEEALALSGFDEDLKTFPMGLHTVVPAGVGSFSGGQAQRLLIARALISKPKILIFDEATSALDNRSQELFSQRIAKIKLTRIFIAHNLSTVVYADRIYVMDKGKVVDTGTFQELANRPGLFQTMLHRQKL